MGKSIPPLSGEFLSSIFNRAKLFAEIFSEKSNFDDLGSSSQPFSSRANLRLYNISINSKIVQVVRTVFDYSKAFDLDYIPLAVLKIFDKNYFISMRNRRNPVSRIVERFYLLHL